MSRQRLLTNGLLWSRLAIAAGLLLWLVVCALKLPKLFENPSKQGVILGAILVLAPLMLVKIGRVPVYLLALYTALVPFTEILATDAGTQVTKLLAAVTALGLIATMIAKKQVVKPSFSLLVLAAVTAYSAASIFWAIDPPKAFITFALFFNLVLFYTVISLYAPSVADVNLIFTAMLVGAMATSVFGILMFFQGQTVDARLVIGVNADRSIDPNDYAAALLTPTAIVLTMFLRSRGLSKLMWAVPMALFVSALLVGGSRGGTIAFGAMLAFFIIRSRFRWQIAAIVPFLAGGFMASPLLPRFMEANVANADGRTEIWKVGLAALHRYWLSGAGIGGFQAAYIESFVATPHRPLEWIRNPHNVLLQSAVELGSIGLVLILAFWYRQFVELAGVRGKDMIADLCLALSAGVLALFVAGFSLDLAMAKYTWLAFSLVALMRSFLVTHGVPLNDEKPRLKQTFSAPILKPEHGT